MTVNSNSMVKYANQIKKWNDFKCKFEFKKYRTYKKLYSQNPTHVIVRAVSN